MGSMVYSTLLFGSITPVGLVCALMTDVWHCRSAGTWAGRRACSRVRICLRPRACLRHLRVLFQGSRLCIRRLRWLWRLWQARHVWLLSTQTFTLQDGF